MTPERPSQPYNQKCILSRQASWVCAGMKASLDYIVRPISENKQYIVLAILRTDNKSLLLLVTYLTCKCLHISKSSLPSLCSKSYIFQFCDTRFKNVRISKPHFCSEFVTGYRHSLLRKHGKELVVDLSVVALASNPSP